MEESANKLLIFWTRFCLRLPGSIAAVACGIYAYKSITTIAAGEPMAIKLTAFIFWAAVSFSLYALGNKSIRLLANK